MVVDIINFYFIIYYGVVLYTMFLFYKNGCGCKKMEKFKRTWNYYYVVIYSGLVFITLSLTYIMNMFATTKVQRGGGVRLTLLLLLSHLPAYLNDYAVIDLLNTMTRENCPCTKKWRAITYNMTIVRVLLSFVLIHKSSRSLSNLLAQHNKRRTRNLIRK